MIYARVAILFLVGGVHSGAEAFLIRDQKEAAGVGGSSLTQVTGEH